MRLFAALVPPTEAVEHLDAFLEVRRGAADFRWSLAEHLHVTLAFYGDVEEWRLDEVVERLRSAAARRTPVEARVAGGGAFPDPAAARVLWAGVDAEPHDELERLAAGCRTAGAVSGARVDGQRFRPHVTVARLRRADHVDDWVRLLEGYRGPAWRATSVALVASHLGQGARRRPRHEVLEHVGVGSGE